MDIGTIGGLVVGVGLILWSIITAGAAIGDFVDIPSVIIVIGGTFAAIFIAAPMSLVTGIGGIFSKAAFGGAQTLALILSYLSANQAATILGSLPQEKQADVAQRIAQMEATSPEVIKEVELVLERKLSSMVTQDYSSTGGIQAIVDILIAVDRGTEKFIMETLEIQEADLAEEIRKRMFVFEDIINLDAVSIQRFIREVDNSELSVALKGSTEEVKSKIFTNMSKRMAEMLAEDMEFMGPVRVRDVEEAQQKIVNIIRKLEEAGEIIISRGGGDEIIV